MADTKDPRDHAGGQPIGSRPGAVHHSRSERARLISDPNRNQAGNDRGSADNAQGSQTGNDIDLIPEIPKE